MPSFYEGFPFSVVEAQCEGLPCFITNTLSKELKLTDLVSFLPLEKPIEWIESIKGIKNKKTTRDQYVNKIIDAGFSIENSYQVFSRALGILSC